MARITYEVFDFGAGTVETREREIDSEQVLGMNAFFQRIKGANMAKGSKKGGYAMPKGGSKKGGKKGKGC